MQVFKEDSDSYEQVVVTSPLSACAQTSESHLMMILVIAYYILITIKYQRSHKDGKFKHLIFEMLGRVRSILFGFVRTTVHLIYFLLALLNCMPCISELFSYTQQAIRKISYTKLEVVKRSSVLLNFKNHNICKNLTCITSAPVY